MGNVRFPSGLSSSNAPKNAESERHHQQGNGLDHSQHDHVIAESLPGLSLASQATAAHLPWK
jgi:hypothetical protein